MGRVLRRDDDVGHTTGTAIFVHHRHLRFGVGTEPVHDTRAAVVSQALRQRVGQHDWKGHEFGCLVSRVAEHDSLIAGTLIL